MIEIAILGAIAFFAYKSGALASLGLAPAKAPAVPTNAQIQQQAQSYVPVQQIPLTSGQVGNTAVSKGTTAAAGAGGAIAAGANPVTAIATAGVGVAVAIGLILWQAHKVREKQAKDENSSMNVGVQGFDQDMRTINDYWNQNKIDLATCIAACQQALQQFWMITVPHIQPGRNGCSGNGSSGTANCVQISTQALAGKNPCTGDVGAACCVGCEALYNSLYAPLSRGGVIAVLQNGGGSSNIWEVFPSKYGGSHRAGYTLTWNKR